jgi:hypothetical protein
MLDAELERVADRLIAGVEAHPTRFRVLRLVGWTAPLRCMHGDNVGAVHAFNHRMFNRIVRSRAG